MPLIIRYSLFLAATLLVHFGHSQSPTVTGVSTVSNNVDTILNFIKTPTLSAWGFTCNNNDSAACHTYLKNSTTNTNVCPTDTQAEYINAFQYYAASAQPMENAFLENYSATLPIDNGYIVGAPYLAYDALGNIFNPPSINIWSLEQKYIVSAGSGANGAPDQCDFQANTPDRTDLRNILNSVPGQDAEHILTFHHTFEFVSGGTYFDFGYVFASDKYDTNLQAAYQYCSSCWQIPSTSNGEHICGYNNDGIAIVLSGPGVTGPYYLGGENIAVVPSTNEPVCVRNIHPQLNVAGPCGLPKNQAYFIAGNDSMAPFPFSGLTKSMSVKKILINPCDTYRINIGLGIAGHYKVNGSGDTTLYNEDGLGTSALIIEKHSARTGFWQVVTTPLFQGYGLDTLVEGCAGAELTFVRFFNTAQPDSIHLEFQGAGINGVDIDSLPEWVYFLPGQDSVSIQVNAAFDQLAEGAEDFTIRLLPPGIYPCPVDTTEVNFTIIERPPFQVFMADTFRFNPCTDAAVTLSVDSIHGLGPFSFLWEDGSVTDSVSFVPDSSGAFSVTVYDACHADSAVLSPLVQRFAPAPVFQKINDNQVINCASGDLPIGVSVLSNYYQQLYYLWASGEADSVIGVNPIYDGQYNFELQAILPCLPDTFDFSFQLQVVNDTVSVSGFDMPAEYCPGTRHALTPSVAGGYPAYQFLWNNGSVNDTIFVQPEVTTTYDLTITDQCEIDSNLVRFTVNIPSYDPLNIVGPTEVRLPCPTGSVSFGNNDFYGVGGTGDSLRQSDYVFSWNNWASTSKVFQKDISKDTFLFLQMTDTCGNDTVVHRVQVIPFKGPFLKATLADTLHACIGQPFQFGPSVLDGVKPYRYRWSAGSSDSTISFVPTKAKDYFSVTVTDFCGFVKAAETDVYATMPLADFDAINDSYEPTIINFENLSSNGAITYKWVFGDGGEDVAENPSYQYQELQDWEVTLIATDTFGCHDSVTKSLDIPLNLFIPNAFSPDGDGLNETWQPLGYGFKEIGYTIYDRWGGVVFSTERSAAKVIAWDGTANGEPLPQGAYTYLIEVKPFVGLVQQITGEVTVVKY